MYEYSVAIHSHKEVFYDERVPMDTRYVRNENVWFDVMLIWRIIRGCIRQERCILDVMS